MGDLIKIAFISLLFFSCADDGGLKPPPPAYGIWMAEDVIIVHVYKDINTNMSIDYNYTNCICITNTTCCGVTTYHPAVITNQTNTVFTNVLMGYGYTNSASNIIAVGRAVLF